MPDHDPMLMPKQDTITLSRALLLQAMRHARLHARALQRCEYTPDDVFMGQVRVLLEDTLSALHLADAHPRHHINNMDHR